MKAPRIAIILPGFSASESDWCIPAILDMVRVLAETHDIDVFPMRYPHTNVAYRVFGANIFPQNGRTSAGIHRLTLSLRTIRAVMRRHKSSPYDLIHALWVDEPGLAGVILSHFLKIPVCASVMGGEFVNLSEIGYGHQQSRAARWMTRFSVKSADVITVGSNFLLEQVKPFTKKRIIAAPLGVEMTRFRKSEVNRSINNSLRLINVGSLIPVKNQAMLLDAFAQLLKFSTDAHLDIVGQGPLEQRLKDKCHQLGISDKVTFHGEVEHHNLPTLYQQADLAVLTSWHESQSIAALEAGATGIATVGTRVGILPELIPDTFLVKPGDSETLSQFLHHLSTNRQVLKELNDSVYQTVNKNFSLSDSIDRWNRIYTDLVTPNVIR